MDRDSPWSLFLKSVEKYGERIVIIDKETMLTYKDACSIAEQFSCFLSHLDFTLCGIYLPNSYRFITCMLGAGKLNKVVVPLSYQLKGESLSKTVNFSDVEFIITDHNGYNEIQKVKEFINVNYIAVLDNSGNYNLHTSSGSKKELSIQKEDIFGICFTSGSTSKPKGVVLSNNAITGNALAVAEFLKFDESDRILIPRSFAQASPISGDILMAISCGGSIVVYCDLFHPAIFLKTIQDFKVTSVVLVNTMLRQVIEYPQFEKFDISSMKRIILGGMPTSRGLIEEALKKFAGIGFYNAYGLTEASTRVTFLGPEEFGKYPQSAGRPIRGCDVKIYEKDGSEVKNGQTGDIYVESDYAMKSYYKNQELTAETLTERGLKTKDIGYKDDNGLLYIMGRNDDLIIQGGTNVFPIEIEEVLLKNPNIKEAFAAGIKDEFLGTRIVAVVSIAESSGIRESDIYKWCRNNMEDRKIPKEIYIIDKIPRSEFGKVSRNELMKYINGWRVKNGEKRRLES